MSARAFSRAIGVADNNTQNYIADKPALPKADFLEKVIHHFQSINPGWLLTGVGEPFVGDEPNSPVAITNKKNKGSVQNNTGDHNTINNVKLEDCQRDLEASKKEAAAYQREIELLKGQLEAKDHLIASKDELLNFLRSGFNRHN